MITRFKELSKADNESKHFKLTTSLFDNLPGLIACVDADTLVYKYVNKRYLEAFELPANKIIGNTVKNVIGDKAYQYAIDYIDEAKKGKTTFYEIEFDLKKGKTWLRVNYVPELNSEGKVISIIVLSYDISAQKKAIEQLKTSEEKFHNLFKNSQVGMFRTKIDGTEILEANNRFLEIFGAKREDVIGKPSVIHWIYIKEREKMVQILKTEGRVLDFECRMRNKKGETRHCLTSLNTYPNQGILEGSIIDITERKIVEEELKQSKNILQKKINELELFNKFAVDRELKMIELKKKIRELEERQHTIKQTQF